MHKLLPFIILFFFPCLLWAQSGTISGQVIDDDDGATKGFRDIIANASAAEGEKVFIAFRYFGASSSGSSSWTIDDLNILVE